MCLSHQNNNKLICCPLSRVIEFDNVDPQERDWRGIVIALVVIMFTCLVIACAVFLFAPMSLTVSDPRTPIKLLNMSRLRSPIYDVQWRGTDAIIYEDITKGVLRFDINTLKTDTLLDTRAMLSYSEYIPSADLRYFALFQRTSYQINHKFNKTFWITILNREKLIAYNVGIKKTGEEQQRIFMWGPTGNDYLFWQSGHIYYSDSAESVKPVQISEGGPNWEHGIFDWMYEEEIFGRQSNAVWWSLTGDKIVYLSREKNKEKSITLISYSRRENYPYTLELPYPKTHEKHLPTYVIKMWDKNLRTLKQIDVQLRDSTAFHYLYGVRWVMLNGKERLVAIWTNRLQNHISVTICDYDTAMCSLVFEHKYDANKWAEPSDFSSILSSGDAIYMLLPRTQSDGNSYQQIAKLLIEMKNGNDFKWAKLSYLSAGNFDVTKLEAFDSATDTLYFTAAAPSPGNHHLFATKGTSTTSDTWTCVSCLFKNCTYQTNLIDASFRRVVTNCEGPAHPHFYLSDLKHNKLENVVRFLHSNDGMLEKRLASTLLPMVIGDTVTLRNGFEARVQILLPSEQRLRSTSRTLPVLLKVYGGPTSQIVTDEFSIGFDEYIVSDRNYALVKIDGRGSNARGWKYRSPIYKVLGTVEIEDQIETLQILTKKYPILDKSRLSIFGWSYGGFVAAKAPEMAPIGFFKCAISVAPVANFLFYDATYTERYMGDAEKVAYDNGDIIRNVSNFRNTHLLLAHGLYDDNVHFQHSALFMEALQAADIEFDLMVYPNQDHSISKRSHLYHKITNFLDKCAQQ